jgi:hypothetical protein
MGAVGERAFNIRVYLSFIEHKALKYYAAGRTLQKVGFTPEWIIKTPN